MNEKLFNKAEKFNWQKIRTVSKYIESKYDQEMTCVAIFSAWELTPSTHNMIGNFFKCHYKTKLQWVH